MSLLSQVTNAAPRLGVRVVIAGAEKVGKTTMCCDAPDVLFVPTEQGYGGVTVQKVPLLTDWGQVYSLCGEILGALQRGQFPFRTIAWDSVTQLEQMIHRHVILLDNASKNNKAASMETAHGGYGKAYAIGDNIFREFLGFCDNIALNFGVNTIFTCHVFAAKVLDPLHGEYDSFDLLLHSPKNQKTYGKREILTQWADVVGYLHQPMTVAKINNVQQGVQTSTGRALGIERTPAYVAGNRYGMRGVIQVAEPPQNAWNSFAHALYAARGIDVFNRNAKA